MHQKGVEHRLCTMFHEVCALTSFDFKRRRHADGNLWELVIDELRVHGRIDNTAQTECWRPNIFLNAIYSGDRDVRFAWNNRRFGMACIDLLHNFEMNHIGAYLRSRCTLDVWYCWLKVAALSIFSLNSVLAISPSHSTSQSLTKFLLMMASSVVRTKARSHWFKCKQVWNASCRRLP